MVGESSVCACEFLFLYTSARGCSGPSFIWLPISMLHMVFLTEFFGPKKLPAKRMNSSFLVNAEAASSASLIEKTGTSRGDMMLNPRDGVSQGILTTFSQGGCARI